MGKKVRVFSAEQKVSVVKRMLSGERTTELARELKIKRTQLYKWKDIYRRFGAEGFSRRRGPAVVIGSEGGTGKRACGGEAACGGA